MRLESKVLRGKPIQVEGRILVPVARRTTGTLRRATIGRDELTAHGGAFVNLLPLGMVDLTDEQERLMFIPDRTRRSLGGMLAVAIVVPALLSLAVRLSRRNQ